MIPTAFTITLPEWASQEQHRMPTHLLTLAERMAAVIKFSQRNFEEGPVHPHWEAKLTKRGIEVVNNVLREEACAVFHAFAQSGNLVYNGRLGGAD